jgi:hypothetical protein
MAKEWSPSTLVDALVAAGAKGMTKSALQKKIQASFRSKSNSILHDLRSAGAIQGPFKKRSDYYFVPQFAPTRGQAQALIETVLRDSGLRLTSKSELSKRANGFLQVFFADAVAALKSEARVVELKGGRSIYYVHREAILEQLRLSDDSASAPPPQNRIRPPSHTELTLDDVRPIYQKLKAEQGGISTVKIYDIMTRLNVAKEDLHRLFLQEAKSGRVSLHRASTTRFAPEVMEAGIRLEGLPEPLVTIVLKEES